MVRMDASSGNGKFGAFRGNERPDRRIHIVTAPRGASRADILARTAKRAGGDYIALIDPDSAFSPETFYRFAEAAERNPEADIIYSDEDNLNMKCKYSIDTFQYFALPDNSAVIVSGWVFAEEGGRAPEVRAYVNGKPLDAECQRIARKDVQQNFTHYQPELECGFRLRAPLEPGMTLNNCSN